MNNTKKNSVSSDPHDTSSSGERRRYGKIVHDDRGTALVEWHDAPNDMERDVLRIEGEEPIERISRRRGLETLSIREEDSFNPYERVPTSDRRSNRPAGKRDLRKLSEWIKMMREMEQRKARGEDSDEE